MAQDRQLQVSSNILEELVACLDAQTAANSNDTPELKTLNSRSGRIISSAITILKSAQAPGSFSGSEIGQYHVDPSNSQFL